MWRRLGRCEYCYWLSGDCSADDFQFSVTDFVTVWSAEFDRTGFVRQITSNNRHLDDISADELLAKVLAMLARPSSIGEYSFDPDSEDTRLVRIVSRELGYALRFEAPLKAGSALDFYEKVTRRLLQTVEDLRSSEKQLCTTLTNKDREIEEYKEEGGQLLLKYLKTPVFNEEKHLAGHRAYKDVFGTEVDIVSDILKCPRKRKIERLEEQEPLSTISAIKEEQTSQPRETSYSVGEGNSGVVKTELKTESIFQHRTSPKKAKRKFLNM